MKIEWAWGFAASHWSEDPLEALAQCVRDGHVSARSDRVHLYVRWKSRHRNGELYVQPGEVRYSPAYPAHGPVTEWLQDIVSLLESAHAPDAVGALESMAISAAINDAWANASGNVHVTGDRALATERPGTMAAFVALLGGVKVFENGLDALDALTQGGMTIRERLEHRCIRVVGRHIVNESLFGLGAEPPGALIRRMDLLAALEMRIFQLCKDAEAQKSVRGAMEHMGLAAPDGVRGWMNQVRALVYDIKEGVQAEGMAIGLDYLGEHLLDDRAVVVVSVNPDDESDQRWRVLIFDTMEIARAFVTGYYDGRAAHKAGGAYMWRQRSPWKDGSPRAQIGVERPTLYHRGPNPLRDLYHARLAAVGMIDVLRKERARLCSEDDGRTDPRPEIGNIQHAIDETLENVRRLDIAIRAAKAAGWNNPYLWPMDEAERDPVE